MSIKRKLRRVLQSAFKGARLELESSVSGKIVGELIWKGFVGKEQLDRQRALHQIMTNRFDEEERRKVSAILTFTPYEVAAMDREAANDL